MLSPQEFLTATPAILRAHLDDYNSLEGRAANVQVHEINNTITDSAQIEQLQKTVAELELSRSPVFFTKLQQMLINAQKALSFRQALFDGVQPEEINDDVLRANAHLFLDITAEQANEIVANISLTQAQHLHRVLPTLGDFGTSCPLLDAVTRQLSSPEFRANQLLKMDGDTLRANGQFFTAMGSEDASELVDYLRDAQLATVKFKLMTVTESLLRADEPYPLLEAINTRVASLGTASIAPVGLGFLTSSDSSSPHANTATPKEDTKAEQGSTAKTEETEEKQEYSSSPSI